MPISRRKQVRQILLNTVGFTEPNVEAYILKFLKTSLSISSNEISNGLIDTLDFDPESAMRIAGELFCLINPPVVSELTDSFETRSNDGNESMEIERKKARITYLKDREAQQIALGKRIYQETTDLYKEVQLDPHDKRFRRLAEQQMTVEFVEKIAKERVPDEKQPSSLNSTNWTTEQIAKASVDEIGEAFGVKIEFEPAQSVFGASNGVSNLENYQRKYEAELEAHIEHLTEIELSRRNLPIYHLRNELLSTIRDNAITIVVGETGSGKTTQIPQFLYEVGYSDNGIIACTQPRRVAAMSVARRVAEEKCCKLGSTVGYNVRFDNCTSENTKMAFLTDGMMLQQFINDPTLSEYSSIIIDEVHERSLSTDVLFALLKDLSTYRPDDLRIIIASATMDADSFSQYFSNAPIFHIPGRCFPVSIYYTKYPEANYITACAITAVQLHCSMQCGNDILVFLPGQAEIQECALKITEILSHNSSDASSIIIIPLYGSLPMEEQARAFMKAPKNKRKVVLSTNIAETSITIDNIVYVIDSGLAKENVYDPVTGMECLTVNPCSQASCNQRAGRAGRTRAGFCFRMFTKNSWNMELEKSNTPEITRTNLTQLVLTLKNLGIDDVVNFDYMSRPPLRALEKALNTLRALRALSMDGDITALGDAIASIPTRPQSAAALLAAAELECTADITIIIALLESGGSLFSNSRKGLHKGFSAEGGDHLLLLDVYKKWVLADGDHLWCRNHNVDHKTLIRAKNIHAQLISILERQELDYVHATDMSKIKKALVSGFFLNIAVKTRRGNYTLLHDRSLTCEIHPSSVYRCADSISLPMVVLYHELIQTTTNYMRTVTDVDQSWLGEINPSYFKAANYKSFFERN